MNRVVVTGIGVVSPIGNNIEDFLKNIKSGKCGIDKITQIDTDGFKTSLAAEVKNFDPKEFKIDSPRKKDRFVQFAIAAAREAMENSGYEITDKNQFRTGVVCGSGIGGLITIQSEYEKFLSKGPKKVSSHFIPKAIVNIASGEISIALKTRGVCTSQITACATGTDSIGEAYRLIKHGYQDAVFAGGCEAAICELGISGFEAMNALSFSDDKNRASIPFDKDRNGFVMGEGACILLLESLESAQKRNAKIICEVVGFSQSSDAYHVTAPNPDAMGISYTMKDAIREAGISKCDVDYINAHGTSTQLNDKTESKAIKYVFGEEAYNLYVSSTKSMTGHMLGATGAIEAGVCALALRDGFVPPTINYHNKDEECDLNYVTDGVIYEDIEYAMSNSLGFGGHNSTIILKKFSK